MQGRIVTVAVALACALVVLPNAAASLQSDFDSVYNDWKPDRTITPCQWTRAQLQNAYDVANGSPDFQYDTGFSDAVQAEIKRWDTGGCAGVPPTTVRRASPLNGGQIVAVRGRGGPANELVRVRNHNKQPLSFRKASLRDVKGKRAVFPAGFKLGANKTAQVHVGCARGKRHASFKAQTVWLCLRKPLFADRGDVARLADASGVVVSQLGYGSQKRRPVF